MDHDDDVGLGVVHVCDLLWQCRLVTFKRCTWQPWALRYDMMLCQNLFYLIVCYVFCKWNSLEYVGELFKDRSLGIDGEINLGMINYVTLAGTWSEEET